jgi:predicted dehydrogenase
MRDSGVSKLCKRLVGDGKIGKLQTVSFGGQRALNYSAGGRASSRTSKSFEKGKHGGALSDIAIHGIDLVQCITGSRARTVTGARSWSTGRAPNIDNCAQVTHFVWQLRQKCMYVAFGLYCVKAIKDSARVCVGVY